MASKIFTGDIPELLEIIFNYLNNEIYSLYSCALVNRHWCKVSIPILWQDPFSLELRPFFISNYFSSLDEDEKFILKKCGINMEISKTLFDYARFLKVLDLSSLENKVRKWFNYQHVRLRPNYAQSLYRINNLLLKLFIKIGATLHKFSLHFLEIKPEIFYSIEQNDQFFSQLQNLSLSGISGFNATTLLSILAKNATKMNALILDGFYPDYDESQLLHALICVIKSQVHLRTFGIVCERYITKFHGIISALESQKNSLQEIIIENCVFSTEFEILKNFENIKILRIRYCDPKLLKILNYKIVTLEIVDMQIDATTTIQILENSGLLLNRLKLESSGKRIREESLILESLNSFCPNITYLNILNVEFSTQLVELIGNLQKLQFLTLWCNDGMPEEELSMRVIQFAKILPLTLQYLDLSDNWLNSHIDIFLNYCNAPLKKLLIYYLNNEKITKALIEFRIRSGALKYVGVYRYVDLDDKIRKDVEAYFTLVPYDYIVVDC
ncbi:hypothetical protein F8M41_017211 [Gigaspora margarita]|uniref:F-box domain-containing protein n=1 Tax=Gigaspora margarita TaxID=4874 RepID=A0A8H4EUR1_GIGMA|nr:hypothetical protein F8M41_017211 [Gigaspora margarita]